MLYYKQMKRMEYSGGEVVGDTLTLSAEVPKIDIDSEVLPRNLEKMKDFLFDSYMKQQLLEDFFESLGGYFDDEEIDLVRGVMAECSDEEIYATLSLPHELRERKFEEFESNIAKGESIQDVIKRFIEVSNKYKFGVGYHCSPVDIRPDDVGSWQINGTEADHRDDDITMAYYSSQYRHLFKKRHPKFIYIVRTDPTTHKTDGNWSRAASLSVVARVPFEEVYKYVEETSKEISAVPEETTD
jgi:hypothetical protein